MIASAQSGPLFLVGAERSGTTLCRLMLSHHRAICFNNEFEYVVDRVSNNGSWPPLDAYYDWLSTHRQFLTKQLEIDSSLDYPHLVRSFLEQIRSRSGKPIIGATVHRHFDRLLHIWPEARFIHLVRDPRDVGRSVIQTGRAGNMYHGVHRWAEVERLWDRLIAELDGNRWIDVRYERLVAAPAAELLRISGFIGVPYDEAMLSYPEDSTYGPPDPSIATRWRDRLSDEEVQLAEAETLELIANRGYKPSGLNRLTLTDILRRRLAWQDRWYRRRHGLRRFGIVLTLLGVIARLTQSRSVQRLVTLRRNEITRRQLK